MQSNNHPAAPDSFERSRLTDLVALHQAIAALGQAPDFMAVIEQRSALYDRVRALHLRIPRSSGHPFHKHLTTDSTVIRPPIPRVSDH